MEANGRRERAGDHGSVAEVAAVFLKLGSLSFGGPVAHLGYFRAEVVEKRKWLGDVEYGDLVALCQFLPGPASSQVVFGLGMRRAGLLGALVASACFIAPSAALMIAFAYGVAAAGDLSRAGWLHGLKLAAVAVVAQAVWGMGKTLCPDRARASLCLASAGVLLVVPGAAAQLGAIAASALAGLWLYGRGARAAPAAGSGTGTPAAGSATATGSGTAATAAGSGTAAPAAGSAMAAPAPEKPAQGGHAAAISALVVFAALLAVLPALAASTGSGPGGGLVAQLDSFYRSGSLVFGGGHVVLPLLREEVVPRGWLTDDQFLAGYGAAQAVPGPLFTFAAYLGAAMRPGPGAWVGGLWCLLAIFLPAWLLIGGALPFWQRLRARASAQAALAGANASVVGVLLAALYSPVFTDSVHAPKDVVAALAAFGLLQHFRAPPWAVVAAMAAAGQWLLGP